MAEEYRAICKDCNNEFGYSEASLAVGSTRGLSRPERCPECRKIHSREGRSIGIPQIKVRRLGPRKPDKALRAGRLGKIIHMERPHKKVHVEGKFGKPDTPIAFGITDDDSRQLIETMERCQVTVVVGPTGSGKSTFLPYRLMVPPEEIDPDIFTRYGQIVITQPRIQATRSISRFVARDLHGSSRGAGFDVGFRHSGAPHSDWRNKLVYITDGTLINWIVSGQISNLSVIMIDEAHERSLNIDIILGLLKIQLPRFPHLKLIIASATINAALFQNYFGGPEKVGLLTFRGLKQHRVDAYFPYHDEILRNDRRVPSIMASKIIDILLSIANGLKAEGDVLGFLPGQSEIEKCVSRVRELIMENPQLREMDIRTYPLYTKLPQADQDLALAQKTRIVRDRIMSLVRQGSLTGKDRIMGVLLDQKSAMETWELVQRALEEEQISTWTTSVMEPGMENFNRVPRQIILTDHQTFAGLKHAEQYHLVTDRRVIISTNVAETSLTVDGIVYTVDSGLIKESGWDGKNSAFDLPTIFHSRAGCRQRWGRAGRVRDGEAHMLYTDLQFEESFNPYSVPEIMRSSLEEVILKAKSAGIDDIAKFDWIEKPPAEELARAPGVLLKMGALDSDGDLTNYGVELESFNADVPIANLLIAADQFACGIEMATLAAMMSVGLQGGVFLWDNGWDFATRASVEHIRTGLAVSCRDDLEFLLKLYAIWAEAGDDNERGKRCRLFFMDIREFENNVALKRDKLLEMLSPGKKAEEDRTINFGLLDRFRIILSTFLPLDFIFHVPKDSTAPVCLNPESVTLDVGIDPTSLAAVRELGHFIALKRRIVRKGNDQFLSLSLIVPIQEDWLKFRDLPVLLRAEAIAGEIRRKMDEKVQGADRRRLFLDVKYPVGARYSNDRGETPRFLPELKAADPIPVKPIFADGMVALPEESWQEPEKNLSPLAGLDEDAGLVAFDPNELEEEDFGSSDDMVQEFAEGGDASDLSLKDRNGDLLTISLEAAASDELMPDFRWKDGNGSTEQLEIIGHDYENFEHPVLVISDYQSPIIERDEKESIRSEPSIWVKPVKVLTNAKGEKALRVLEENTKTEFIVDPRSLSFSLSRSFVERFEIDNPLEMRPESDSHGNKRLSYLPVAERKMGEFLKSNPALTSFSDRKPVSCIFVGKRFFRLYFVIDAGQGSGMGDCLTAEMKKSYDDKTRYQEGKTYPLYLDLKNGEASVSMPSPPEDLLAFIEKIKFSHHLFWNKRKLCLHSKKPLTVKVRDELYQFSKAAEYQRVIQNLYRDSNIIHVTHKDFKKKGYVEVVSGQTSWDFQEEVPVYKEGETVHGNIFKIFDKNALVQLKRGGTGSVSIGELGWEYLLDPREIVYAGEEIEAMVLRRTDKGLDLTMKQGITQRFTIKRNEIETLRKDNRRVIRHIRRESCCDISCFDDGTVRIKGPDQDATEYAVSLIKKRLQGP